MQNINPITVSDSFILFTLNIREGESGRSTCSPDRLHDFLDVLIGWCQQFIFSHD